MHQTPYLMRTQVSLTGAVAATAVPQGSERECNHLNLAHQVPVDLQSTLLYSTLVHEEMQTRLDSYGKVRAGDGKSY